MRIKTGEYRKCPICQNKFYVKRCFVLRGIGKYCSKKCLGKSKKGKIPNNLKYAQSRSPIKKGNKLASCNFGEKHWNWQKENPSYRAVHAWIRKHYGQANKCENEKCVYPRKDW